MKLLVDACGGVRLAKGLLAAGYEVEFVGEWPQDPGDNEILHYAFRSGAIVITRDKDFGTLAVLHQQPHSGIVRLVELSPITELERCLDVLRRYGKSLENSALITVQSHRVRIREN